MTDLEKLSLERILDDIQTQVWMGYLELDDNHTANDFLESALEKIRKLKEAL